MKVHARQKELALPTEIKLLYAFIFACPVAILPFHPELTKDPCVLFLQFFDFLKTQQLHRTSCFYRYSFISRFRHWCPPSHSLQSSTPLEVPVPVQRNLSKVKEWHLSASLSRSG
jgi:hypothetical protein